MEASAPHGVVVYASASRDTPEKYLKVAQELGAGLARINACAINGGGKYGCMGALNQSVKKNNGTTLGVIHQQWVDGEADEDLDHMIIVGGDDLGERKRGLLAEADCIVALPGGVS